MAGYALYLGPPVGTTLLGKTDRLRRPDDLLPMRDHEVQALGVTSDPYTAHEVWCGPDLGRLYEALGNRLAAFRAEAARTVALRIGRGKPPELVEAMVEREVRADPRVGHALRLMEMVARAQDPTTPGTIVYLGD